MFTRFIEERSFVCDVEQGLSFFDECVERAAHAPAEPLLGADTGGRAERTVFVLPPDADAPAAAFAYPRFELAARLLRPRAPPAPAHPATAPAEPDAGARRTKHEVAKAQRCVLLQPPMQTNKGDDSRRCALVVPLDEFHVDRLRVSQHHVRRELHVPRPGRRPQLEVAQHGRQARLHLHHCEPLTYQICCLLFYLFSNDSLRPDLFSEL